jgi:hypothetical protein
MGHKEFIKKVGVREFNTHDTVEQLSSTRQFHAMGVNKVVHDNDTPMGKGFVIHMLFTNNIVVVLNGLDLFDFYRVDEDFNVIKKKTDIYLIDFFEEWQEISKAIV